jgi:hypothetical protein
MASNNMMASNNTVVLCSDVGPPENRCGVLEVVEDECPHFQQRSGISATGVRVPVRGRFFVDAAPRKLWAHNLLEFCVPRPVVRQTPLAVVFGRDSQSFRRHKNYQVTL